MCESLSLSISVLLQYSCIYTYTILTLYYIVDVSVDNLITKFILPYGAFNINMEIPYRVVEESLGMTTRYYTCVEVLYLYLC